MDKENENTKILVADLEFLEEDLGKTNTPFRLEELVKKIAIKKTSSQLSQKVKVYDPYCLYEVGDLLFKEYNEPLIVSSKGAEPFEGTVVLKIISKIPYESFNCEMLEVDYTGGGTFRKHIDYMKKTQTQVLLPSNLDGLAKTPQILKRDEDPRLDELPMTEKDLKKLQKNLVAALTKSDKFFTWNKLWHLTAKQVPIADKKIKEVEKYFRETKLSAATAELVKHLFNLDESSELYDLHCLSLNHVLDQKYKKNILFVSPKDKGKWLPKDILDSFLKDLPLSPRRAKLPKFEDDQGFKSSQAQQLPLKVYLTWREIHSGGIKIPKGLTRELSNAREYIFTDAETEKDYTVYFYPSSGILLGLKEFYEENNTPQGASLTLERIEEEHFKFRLKKSKRKLTVLGVSYDSKEDKFSTDNKETATHCLPHKIIHLETDTLLKLFALYEQRDKMDLRELLILIFKNFGLEGEALSLHYLRAFHLVDLLKHTSQDDVEKTLVQSPEFVQSEKNAGIYLYTEKVKAGEEILPEEVDPTLLGEETEPSVEELSAEDLLEIGTVGEVESFVELQEVEEVEEPVEVKPEVKVAAPPPEPKTPPMEEPKRERAEKTKKEKAPKKKRQRMKLETERAPKRRKGEKKFIEERIEQEESEMEALIAVKADTKAKPKRAEAAPKKDVPAKEKKEEFKLVPSEEPMVGIFGDMLKTALKKKKDPKTPEEEEKTTKPKAKKSAKKTTKKPAKKTEKTAEKKTEKKK